MATGSTTYWEIAAFALAAAQAVFYLAGLIKYKNKLEDYADKALTWAEQDKVHYAEFRSADPAFYAYYMGLPEYNSCESAVRRQRGAAFNRIGQAARMANDQVAGYRPLARIGIQMERLDGFVAIAHTGRGAQKNIEETTANAYAINKASIIASAPTGTEGVNAAPVLTAMGATALASMSNMGQGINSALVGMGTVAYRWRNDTKTTNPGHTKVVGTPDLYDQMFEMDY